MEQDQIDGQGSEKREGEGGGHEKAEPKEHLFTVFVNGQPVELLGHAETGSEIKRAAIEQGVPIHLSFVLEEELPDGARRIVEDHERVHLRENLRFIAREPVVIISVNEQPVDLCGHMATGAEIKEAAIAQGVHIELNFVLLEELPNGTSRNVGDNDKVHLREHLRFAAIRPDDNS